MLKLIWAIVFAFILFLVVRSSLISYIASNENIVAILVIFIMVIINTWVINLINKFYNKKARLDK